VFSLDELRDAHRIVQTALTPTPTHAWPLLAKRLGTLDRDQRDVLRNAADLMLALVDESP